MECFACCGSGQQVNHAARSLMVCPECDGKGTRQPEGVTRVYAQPQRSGLPLLEKTLRELLTAMMHADEVCIVWERGPKVVSPNTLQNAVYVGRDLVTIRINGGHIDG